jgi:hypothetical protein
MAIREVEAFGRTNIGWLGRDPSDEAKAAFKERGFTVVDRALTEFDLLMPAQLAGLAAVVIEQRLDQPSLFFNAVQKCVRRLLDYDCRVFVVPAEIRGLPQVYDALELIQVPASNLPSAVLRRFRWQSSLKGPDRVPPLPHVGIYSPQPSWSEIANFLACNRPGAPPNENVQLEFDRRAGFESAGIRPNARLLKRAFVDCSEVHLVPMTEGNSGVCVYRAYPLVGTAHLMPRFVKVGERRKILQEFRNYQIYVERSVPFHLGPRLNYDRCCLGANQGVLVGDFIDASESLETSARGGRSGPAIACLFDRTLYAWYRGAEDRAISIADALKSRFPTAVVRRRLGVARRHGAKRELRDLRHLFLRCDRKPTKFARIHGDLHVNNVRVRGHEALVLDFYAHNEGPMLFDLATMEASLLVEAFGSVHPEPFANWVESMLPLYDNAKIDMVPPHGDPRDVNQWFHEAVRQLRHYALRVGSADQYAAALGLALLIKASKDPRKQGPEDDRRSAAYVLAEKVLVNNFGP